MDETRSDGAGSTPPEPAETAPLEPTWSEEAATASGAGETARSEQSHTTQKARDLKPYADAAEETAYQLVKASQKGLNWLAGFLGERHDRRATEKLESGSEASPAAGESPPHETPDSTV